MCGNTLIMIVIVDSKCLVKRFFYTAYLLMVVKRCAVFGKPHTATLCTIENIAFGIKYIYMVPWAHI